MRLFVIAMIISVGVLGCDFIGSSKEEWYVLQTVEAENRSIKLAEGEIDDKFGYVFLCVKASNDESNIWIMLNPHSKPYYKQMPNDLNFVLSQKVFDEVYDSGKANPIVLEELKSHLESKKQ